MCLIAVLTREVGLLTSHFSSKRGRQTGVLWHIFTLMQRAWLVTKEWMTELDITQVSVFLGKEIHSCCANVAMEGRCSSQRQLHVENRHGDSDIY